jgi:hypothetical protein
MFAYFFFERKEWFYMEEKPGRKVERASLQARVRRCFFLADRIARNPRSTAGASARAILFCGNALTDADLFYEGDQLITAVAAYQISLPEGSDPLPLSEKNRAVVQRSNHRQSKQFLRTHPVLKRPFGNRWHVKPSSTVY